MKTTPAAGKGLLDDIAKITPKSVTTVILSHGDDDHVNGLASFPKGITITAQENDKKEQKAGLAAGGRGAPPADHLPTQVVTKNKETLKIRWRKGGSAPLGSRAYERRSRCLSARPEDRVHGNIITTQPDALIHLEKQGSSEGWITTTKGIVALNPDEFVPGHATYS